MRVSNGILRQPRRSRAPFWSEERIIHLTTLWSQGLSARQISRELGHGISRGTVLAKIHRLGIGRLSPRGGWRRPPPARTEKPPASAGLAAIVPTPIWLFRPHTTPVWVANAVPHVDDPLADADVPRAQRRSLLQLNCRTCRWPVGDPAKSDFFFCGAVPREGEAYCAAHCARAVRPVEQTAEHGKRRPSFAPSLAPLGARRRRTMRELRDLDKLIAPGGEAGAETRSEEGA